MKLEELTCISKNINVDDYLSFKNQVRNNMEHPEWLRHLSKEELEELLENGSRIWIYYLNDEPICSMMLIKTMTEELQKLSIPFSEKEIVDYGGMFVNPNYLGNKLQYQMLKVLDKYAEDLGYKCAIGTIHPSNSYSINNFLQDNFQNECNVELRRGPRCIFLKELNEKSIIDFEII